MKFISIVCLLHDTDHFTPWRWAQAPQWLPWSYKNCSDLRSCSLPSGSRTIPTTKHGGAFPVWCLPCSGAAPNHSSTTSPDMAPTWHKVHICLLTWKFFFSRAPPSQLKQMHLLMKTWTVQRQALRFPWLTWCSWNIETILLCQG